MTGNAFEIIAIDSGGGDASPMRKRLEAAFDEFLYIADLRDERGRRPDPRQKASTSWSISTAISVRPHGRVSARAAPVQVNYLGFPGTLGADYMDYIIADRIVIPEANGNSMTKRSCICPAATRRMTPAAPSLRRQPSRAAAGLPDKGFVFCNFNQGYKLTPRDIRLLDAHPEAGARAACCGCCKARRPLRTICRQAAARQGMAADRLVFAPLLPLAQHLARLKLADLFLDGLPYNAHTTASDALWAGVPLLTLAGHDLSRPRRRQHSAGGGPAGTGRRLSAPTMRPGRQAGNRTRQHCGAEAAN